MSSTGYVATPKVRHIAVWTATGPTRGVGHHRNLCGRPRLIGDNIIWAEEVGPNPTYVSPDPEWQQVLATAMRRPVCKDCTRVARQAYDLAGGAS